MANDNKTVKIERKAGLWCQSCENRMKMNYLDSQKSTLIPLGWGGLCCGRSPGNLDSNIKILALYFLIWSFFMFWFHLRWGACLANPHRGWQLRRLLWRAEASGGTGEHLVQLVQLYFLWTSCTTVLFVNILTSCVLKNGKAVHLRWTRKLRQLLMLRGGRRQLGWRSPGW